MSPRPASAPEFLHNAVVFGRLLRRAGLPVSPTEARGFLRALELVDVGNRTQVFHAARSFLVHRQQDLRLFETLFNAFFRPPGELPGRGQKAPLAPRHDPRKPQRYDLAALLAERARAASPEVEVGDRTATWSREEVLRRKDFSLLSPEELEAVLDLLRKLRWQAARRESRRLVPDRRGERLALRRILREAARTGGVPFRLPRLRRKIKERPVVLLADVSGSMERYSRLVLQLFWSLHHGLRDVECFVFGTRLSRITTALALRNIDRALAEAGREVVDWSGGTRIGDSLATFNREWSRRVLRRGAIVVIVSDGWERGDAALLVREMRYLSHRCHRLLWLNPHLGQSDYRPLVEGMAAALPFVDDFLPVHNLQTLEALALHLGALGDAGRR